MTELDVLIEISAKLDQILWLRDYIYNACMVIIQYGQVYLPLIFVLMGMWFFFKQFLSRYR